MVKAEAIADNSKGGCNVSISMNGNGRELVEEALALIQGVMGSLKDEDVILHMFALKAIAENSEILIGKHLSDEEAEARLATVMSRNILKKGVN